MYYVGLDIHKAQSTICLLDPHGKRISTETIRGPWLKLFEKLKEIPKPFAVCFEASNGYGYIHENLLKLAKRVAVAHPGQLRLIFRSKHKNDRADAEKLAKLLFLDEVPPVHVPNGDVRAWRSLIEHRHRLVGERTRAKNALRALCRSHGITAPRNVWYSEGRSWLRELEWPTEMEALQRDIMLERIESINLMILRVERILRQKALSHIGVSILMTIPAVGIRTAEAIVAYIDEPGRFRKNKSIGNYFGLVPRQDASGSVNRLGHITRTGPSVVRKLLVESAWQGVRSSPRIRSYYERVMNKDPQRKKIAIVATAHYLLRVMLAMLTTGECWRDEEKEAA